MTTAVRGLQHLLPDVLGIVGAGQLGAGISDLACRTALSKVVLVDNCPAALSKVKGLWQADKSLTTAVTCMSAWLMHSD